VRLGHIFPFSLAFEHVTRIQLVFKLFGGYSEGDTPVPIPNTEVKPFSADGTARETAWESRTPPRSNGRALRESEGLFAFIIPETKLTVLFKLYYLAKTPGTPK
jgi:hypothetical protein